MIYAVNKRTKEHRIHEGAYWKDDDHEYVQADPDGWIEWQGGGCPLPDGEIHDVTFRDGQTLLGYERPESWYWHPKGEDSDIIAYRPILDADTKPEPPAWDGEGLPPVGCECEYLYSEGNEWRRGRCAAHYRGRAVVVDSQDMGAECLPPHRVRPIRSEEDVAVEEMLPIICNNRLLGIDGEGARDVARALYRAGYRKTGGE